MAKAVWLKQGTEKCYPSPYWPIGSIYISTVNQDPSIYFGGTWEALPGDCYLITTPSSQSVIGTGGSWYTEDTALTVDQIPAHNHPAELRNQHDTETLSLTVSGLGKNYGTGMSGILTQTADWGSYSDAGWLNVRTTNAGGGQGHNHKYQPPYYQVWAWKRIS